MSATFVVWGIVVAYVVVIFSLGMSKAREIGSADDFLVAGRTVPWFFLFCTMGATIIGGGASIGAIGRTYEWGILMVLVSSGWYIHLIVSGLFVAPLFRRAGLYTVAGFFGHWFGEGPRFLVMVLSLLFSIFIVAAQMAASGSVIAAILPDFAPERLILTLTILVGGIMVIVYSTAGGLKAVIYTDLFQFIILFAGFVITMLFCIPDVAGRIGALPDRIPADFFVFHGGKGVLFLVTTFLAFLLGEAFAPGYATRYCVGKDERHTRIGIAGVGAFLALTFPLILFVIALYARIHFPDSDPQQALPLVIRQLNNPVVGGLIIGALLMAVMSSADSALNSATAIFVKDLFEHQLGWCDSPQRPLLRLARICTVALGGVSVIVALLWPNIIDLLLFTYHIWAPAVIVPVVVGAVYRKRAHALSRHIMITMLCGTGAALTHKGLQFVLGRSSGELSGPLHTLLVDIDTSIIGVGVSLAAFAVARLAILPRNGRLSGE